MTFFQSVSFLLFEDYQFEETKRSFIFIFVYSGSPFGKKNILN